MIIRWEIKKLKPDEAKGFWFTLVRIQELINSCKVKYLKAESTTVTVTVTDRLQIDILVSRHSSRAQSKGIKFESSMAASAARITIDVYMSSAWLCLSGSLLSLSGLVCRLGTEDYCTDDMHECLYLGQHPTVPYSHTLPLSVMLSQF